MSINQEKIFNKVYETLAKDKSFKEKFLANPRKEIENVSGEKVPDDIKIEVYESKENDLHLVVV
jgi:hypothetical protein